MTSQITITSRFSSQVQHLPQIKKKMYTKESLDYQNGNFNIGFTTNNVIGGTEIIPFCCKICFGLPRSGIEIRECGHTYCRPCIEAQMRQRTATHYELTFHCPYCRVLYVKSDIIDLGKTSKHLMNQYTGIDVRCAYGCGFVGNPINTVQHEKLKCKQRPISCPHLACSSSMTEEAMDKHIEECEHRLIYCEHCGLPHIINSIHDCVRDLRLTIARVYYFKMCITLKFQYERKE